MSSLPQQDRPDQGPDLWMSENVENLCRGISSSDVEIHEYHEFGSVSTTLGQQRLPGPPHHGESPAQLQVWESKEYSNDAWASSDADTSVHSQFELVPLTLNQRRLPGPPQAHYGEIAAQFQGLSTQEYANNELAYSDANTHTHLTRFQFVPAPFTLDQQLLPGPLPVYDGESATQFQDFTTQEYPNSTLAYSDADHTHIHPTESQFGLEQPFQQRLRLHSPSQEGINPAQLQFLGSEVHPNYVPVSQLLPPGLVLEQSTGGGAPERSPGTAQLTSAQEAEPRQHRSAVQPEYPRRCHWSNCVTVTNFKRPQELERHVREVHEVHGPPPKCPFCPRTWKRAYNMKNHLKKDHREKLAEDVFERILVLEGKKLFAFVDTIKPPQ